MCRSTEMPNNSMSLAAYFIALFVLSYGECLELWAAIQHVKALGDIGYYKNIRPVNITYHSLFVDCSKVGDFYWILRALPVMCLSHDFDIYTLGHSNRNSSGYLPVPFLDHKHFLLVSSKFDIGKMYFYYYYYYY